MIRLKPGGENMIYFNYRQNDILFEFQSALNPGNEEFTAHLGKHGDAVLCPTSGQHLCLVKRLRVCAV